MFILYLLHNLSIFSVKLNRFFTDNSFAICKDCLAILSSGRFSRCSQNFIRFISISPFNGSLPSSFLQAAFGHHLLTPRNCLQKKTCVFSMISFSRELKSSLSYAPHTSDPYVSMGRNSESKILFTRCIGNLEKSR